MAMVSPSERPPLFESVSPWLDTAPRRSGVAGSVQDAFEACVGNRYFGPAEKLRQINALRRGWYDDHRSVEEAIGVSGEGGDLTVGSAACNATYPEKGRLRFRLARVLSPGPTLELGTTFGGQTG